MNYENAYNKMKQYLLARIPFISFKTVEKTRAIGLLEELSKDLNTNMSIYSMSKGTIDIKTKEVLHDDKTIIGALDFISQEIKSKENTNFILTDTSELDEETFTTRYLTDIVTIAEEKNCSIIVITTNKIYSPLQRLGMSIDLDFPNEQELYTLIKSIVEPYKTRITLEWDDNNFKEAATILLGISTIEVKNVILSLIAKGSIIKQDLIDLKFAKDKLFSNISGLEKISIEDNISYGGLDNLKNWLDEKEKLFSPAKKEEMKKRGLRPPRGILIMGVPGSGKSLSAKAIASRWKLPLYLLDFATVQGKYVGQSEQQLKEALETAEHVSPCILWVDEIEKGLSGNSDSGVTTRMIGQFLFWLQECKKEVFVVATANEVTSLPPELLRKGRFDEVFFIDLPNQSERKDIILLYLKKYLNINISENFLNTLITLSNGFSGSDIETSIRDIAYRIISSENSLTEKIIIDSFKKTIPLSKANPDRIEAIRNWGKERALSASTPTKQNTSQLEQIETL